MARIAIFDTTLRDGEQAPGAAMTARARERIASDLEDANVDVVEAGFPAASPLVAQSVRSIAQRARRSVTAALARCTESDVDAAWESIRVAPSPRIHTFIATSSIHLEKKLRMTPDTALEAAVASTRAARRRCPDVEFSAEDATRSDPAFLARIFSAVIAAGARTINVPDTVGYTTPDEYATLIRYLFEHVDGIENAVVSVHTHDDLGLATANALAAIEAGARQVECTVNGIGERAGNCPLEEVVAALRVRADRYGVETSFDLRAIVALSRRVARATATPVQKNKAVVGANAFAHQSGIHQDGILKDRRTYEILDPRELGGEVDLPLGRQSGSHALFARATKLGFAFSGDEAPRFAARFRELADRRRTVSDRELRAIAADVKEIRDAAIAL